jgi:predicted nucleotidyltransferase
MTGKDRLHLPEGALTALCRRYHIKRLSVFGSVLREDFRPDSDVDVLVEFEPGTRPTYFTLSRIEAELSHLTGRRADVHMTKSLHPYIRDKVLTQAEDLYVGA